MLPFRMARPRLGRVSISTPRTQAQKSYSTKSPSSNRMRSIATAGAISAPGLWWLISARDDVPSLEEPPVDHPGIEPGPSKEQVTELISQEAYSFPVSNIPGVNRYDGTRLASNNPCEDQFTHGKLPSPFNHGQHWMAWAVFDGHSGWQTADLLKRQLLPFVRRSLGLIESSPKKDSVPEELVQRAIMQGFVNLDDSIFKTALDAAQSNKPFHEKVKAFLPVYAGSCALLSLYDPGTSTVHVACTGDSRAVLGQQTPDGKWEAIPLSVDQTGSNKEEILRLQAEHPGEPEMVKGGRVLGMMVSRAFGDGPWKWPLEFQQEIKKRFSGPSLLTPRYPVRTPPYLTAEPVVTSTKIDPGRPSFLIMATDGMWDMLTSQQAVNLVGKWIESESAETRPASTGKPAYEPFDFGQFWKGASWRFVESRSTFQDENAAVHLVRNSLGGDHHELVAGRLAFSAPHSRRVRDDMTVQVVFFNTPRLKSRQS